MWNLISHDDIGGIRSEITRNNTVHIGWMSYSRGKRKECIWMNDYFHLALIYPYCSMYNLTVEITNVDRRSFIRVRVTNFIRLAWVKLNGADQTTTLGCCCGIDWDEESIVATWLSLFLLFGIIVRLKNVSFAVLKNNLLRMRMCKNIVTH